MALTNWLIVVSAKSVREIWHGISKHFLYAKLYNIARKKGITYAKPTGPTTSYEYIDSQEDFINIFLYETNQGCALTKMQIAILVCIEIAT